MKSVTKTAFLASQPGRNPLSDWLDGQDALDFSGLTGVPAMKVHGFPIPSHAPVGSFGLGAPKGSPVGDVGALDLFGKDDDHGHSAFQFAPAPGKGLAAGQFPAVPFEVSGPKGFGVAQPAADVPVHAEAAALLGGVPEIGMGVNAVIGYTPGTNSGQWNIPALFGPNAASILKQFNGKGVKVAVYDDGLDKSVLANMTNYDASRELVIGGVKADPYNLGGGGQGIHGTATFGIIGADASLTDGKLTGIAYGATMTAVNVFNGAASGSGMLNAIGQMKNFDVTSNSYGWTSKWADFADVPGSFGQVLVTNLTSSAVQGRGGLGTVIVKSSGNDWLTDHRDANTQEFNADRHVLVVGAVGQNGDVSYYSQRGASVLVSAYSNGGGAGILTTDRTGAAGYDAGNTTNTFGGTSAAAPEVAAIVADMLSANSKLGARDIENILAMSARDTQSSVFSLAKSGNEEYGWGISKANTWNGGGYHFSNDVGFGTVDGRAAIREAEVYSYFGAAQTYNNEVSLTATAAGKAVPASGGATFQFAVTGNMTVEDVSLSLGVTTKNLNNMKVVLTDPYGNKSVMLDTSTTLAGETGNAVTNRTWTLGSHAFQGEAPSGTWTATVTDGTASDGLVVNSAKLGIYGASSALPHVFHYTDEALKMLATDATRLTLKDPGQTNSWMDTAMMSGNTVLDLRSGTTSTVNGQAFVKIDVGTKVNNVTLGDGMAQVTGNDDANVIVGGHGSHIMRAGAGNDTLVAGWAGGTMYGGAGADTFKFDHVGFGREALADFQKGVDVIDLRGLGESMAGLTFAQQGSTVMIGGFANAGDAILVNGVTQLHASDFLFA